jgi:hypothetical protein
MMTIVYGSMPCLAPCCAIVAPIGTLQQWDIKDFTTYEIQARVSRAMSQCPMAAHTGQENSFYAATHINNSE